jgi:hypothetical protein
MIELFKLKPGVDHFLPHEETDVRPCYDLRHIYGYGLGDVDLTNSAFIPFRMAGSPMGRTDLVLGAGFFLLMTPRLLHLLVSLGDFPHQVIPAHLVPDRDDWRDHPPIDTTSFVVCNLHQHLHIIDFNRSVLTPYEVEDGMRRMDQLVAVEGVSVPPLFRQANWPLPPLIPASTRDAILAAGMLDVFMPPLHGSMIRLSDIRLPQP